MGVRALIALAAVFAALVFMTGCRTAEPVEAARATGAGSEPAAGAGESAGTMSAEESGDPLAPWREPEATEVLSDLYYSISMMGSKVGWQRSTRAKTEWNGKEAVLYTSTMRLSLTALGSKVEQSIAQSVVLTPEGWPIRAHYALPEQTVEVAYLEDEILYERTAAGATRRGSTPVPAGANLTDPEAAGFADSLESGRESEYYVFEPNTLQLLPSKLKAVGDESVQARGRTYACVKATCTIGSTTTLTVWVDSETDETVKMVSSAAAMELVVEDEEVAMAVAPGYTPDLAEQTRVLVDARIPNPGKCLDLRLRVSKLPSKAVMISDERQTWSDVEEASDGTFSGVLTIRSAPAPSLTEALPESAPDKFLAASSHIESDDERLVKQAKDAAGKAETLVAKTHAAARWVTATMTSDSSVGGLRSALEVLEDPRGVCRDYAALYAGVARAAGVPTKFCAGCVYWDRGDKPGFYYHAWNESYIGQNGSEERWVALDTTRPEPWPVDATHVKFAEGEYGCMIDIVGLIGQIEIEVLP